MGGRDAQPERKCMVSVLLAWPFLDERCLPDHLPGFKDGQQQAGQARACALPCAKGSLRNGCWCGRCIGSLNSDSALLKGNKTARASRAFPLRLVSATALRELAGGGERRYPGRLGPRNSSMLPLDGSNRYFAGCALNRYTGGTLQIGQRRCWLSLRQGGLPDDSGYQAT